MDALESAQRNYVCLAADASPISVDILLARQTPNNDFVWGDTHFSLNNEEGCSWLCVLDHFPTGYATTIPRHRRILVVTEPMHIRHYSDSCLAQYGTVLSPYPRPSSYEGQWIHVPILYYWYYGYSELLHTSTKWDELKAAKPNKTKLLSSIQTDKVRTPAQLYRSRLVQALKEKIGDQLDIFGRSSHYLLDKADAIDPYKYHLVVENDAGEHFWSEKLADCYLGEAYPIHIGCTNLHDYFPQQAYTSIPNSTDIPQAVKKIKEVITSDLWHKNRVHILEAKQRIMEEYQLFPIIDRIVRQAPQSNHQSLTPVSLQDGIALYTEIEVDSSEPVIIARLGRFFSRDYYRRFFSRAHFFNTAARITNHLILWKQGKR